MKFSEFLDLLNENGIDYDYDGWNFRPVLQYREDAKEEYSFRIYLEEDDDSDIRNKPISRHKNPVLTIV